MKRFIINCAIMTLLMSSTARAVEDDTLSEKEQEACMILFEEIMEIQETRAHLRWYMHVMGQARAAKMITKRRFQKIFKNWLIQENALATEVNELYIKADSMRCFTEVQEG